MKVSLFNRQYKRAIELSNFDLIKGNCWIPYYTIPPALPPAASSVSTARVTVDQTDSREAEVGSSKIMNEYGVEFDFEALFSQDECVNDLTSKQRSDVMSPETVSLPPKNSKQVSFEQPVAEPQAKVVGSSQAAQLA
ncbi:hypothetical protein DFH28DRAFT_1158322 [Melampsora americana]|nr:hypothetical protein DFH28DRAFT_1158322 [Melampsora americana]